jgi:predicted GNAT family N-acyltransferase
MNKFKFQKVKSSDQMELCHAIRKKVFCEEQKISEDIEFDNLDDICEHFLVFNDQIAIATARVRKKQDYVYKIERVAVLILYRKLKVGTLLIKQIIDQYQKVDKKNSIILHSQISVENFYKSLKFISYGKEFTEDGILHIAMKH